MTTPKDQLSFRVTDQYGRHLFFYRDNQSYWRRWQNAPVGTPARLVRCGVSRMSYAIAFLDYWEQTIDNHNATAYTTSQDKSSVNDEELAAFFGPNPRSIKVTP